MDNHSTVEQVIASDADIRIAAPATDHYLVCDRTGACATIEFLEGKLVYRTSESLAVKALTNSTYRDSLSDASGDISDDLVAYTHAAVSLMAPVSFHNIRALTCRPS